MNDPYTLTPDRAPNPNSGRSPTLPARAAISHRSWTASGPGLRDGGGQHPNRPAQQRITRLGVRPAVPVRRADEPRVVDRSRRLPRRWPPAPTPRSSAWVAATSTGCRANCVERIAPKPGTGPSERAARTAITRSRRTPRRPGRATWPRCRRRATPATRRPRCCWGRAALALALDRDQLSDLRGVLTPAAAMGDALLVRFPAAGVSLETTRLN